MVEIRILDENWMEEIINNLLAADEGMTGIDKDVRHEKGYLETEEMISTIEEAAAGTPAGDMLAEYGDAIEDKSGYECIAAYLNGIKKGFQLAMFLKPEGEAAQAAGRREAG